MIINNIGINFAGGGGGGSEARLESKDFTLTQNGSTPIRPTSGYDGISGGTIEVNVDTTPAYNSGYTEGYASGYTSGETDGYATGYASGETAGIAEQKALLTSTTITENGTVTSENGFSAVTIDVQGEENRFNKFMTDTLTAVTQNDLSGVTSIPQFCFYNKTNLKSVDLPSSVKTLGQYAFQHTDIETLDVSNITGMGTGTFSNCKSLTGLTGLENCSFEIQQSLFGDCTNLTDIRTSMYTKSGQYYNNIQYVFRRCSGLRSVTWLSNQNEVTSNASYSNAYEGCTSMEYIDYTHNYLVPPLRYVNPFTAFTADYEIRVPQILYDEWTASTNWNNSAIVGHIKAYPNPNSYSMYYIKYTTNDNQIITPSVAYNSREWDAGVITNVFNTATNTGSLSFYGNFHIPMGAYHNKNKLTAIKIPRGVTIGGEDTFNNTGAFQGCGLRETYLNNVTINKSGHFGSCGAITSATLVNCTYNITGELYDTNQLKRFTLIGEYPTQSITLNTNAIEDITYDCPTMPSDNVYFNNSRVLTAATFGSTVESLGDWYLFRSNASVRKLAFNGQKPSITTTGYPTFAQGLATTGNIFVPREYLDEWSADWSQKVPRLANWNWYPATFADAEIDIAEAGPHKIGYNFAELYALYDVLIDGVSIKASLGDETYNFPSAGTYVITYIFNDSTITTVPEGTDIKSFRASYSMTSVNNYALSNCTALTEVSLPEVTQIGTFSFESDALADMYAPKLVNIGKKALRYNSNFNPVTYFDFSQLETIGDNAFASTGVDEVHFGPCLSSVSYNLFNSCPNLKVITFDENTTGLTEFQSVGDNIPLETITFPDCIQTYCQASMQYGLFKNSSALSAVTFGSGATTFQGLVFGGSMPALTSITCKATTAPSILSGAFAGVTGNTGTLYVPTGSDYSTWLTELGSNWTVSYIS